MFGENQQGDENKRSILELSDAEIIAVDFGTYRRWRSAERRQITEGVSSKERISRSLNLRLAREKRVSLPGKILALETYKRFTYNQPELSQEALRRLKSAEMELSFFRVLATRDSYDDWGGPICPGGRPADQIFGDRIGHFAEAVEDNLENQGYSRYQDVPKEILRKELIKSAFFDLLEGSSFPVEGLTKEDVEKVADEIGLDNMIGGEETNQE